MPSPFLFLVTFTILSSFCSFKLWFRMRIISENWFNHTLHNLLTKIMCIKSVGDFRLVEMFWMCFASKSKKKGEVRLNCMASKFNNKFEFAMAKLITHTHTHKRSYPKSRKTRTLFTISLKKQERSKAFNINKREKYLFLSLYSCCWSSSSSC